jgi:hypothetical protein
VGQLLGTAAVDEQRQIAACLERDVGERPERPRREERVATAPEHTRAARRAEGAHEGCLPSSRLAADQHHPASASGRGGERPGQSVEQRRPLEKPCGGRLLGGYLRARQDPIVPARDGRSKADAAARRASAAAWRRIDGGGSRASYDRTMTATMRESTTPNRLISRERLIASAGRHGVSEPVAEAIWADLQPASHSERTDGEGLRRDGVPFAHATSLSRAVKVMLYLGAFLVIGSYGWWAGSLGFGAGVLLALSLVYGAGFLATGLYARSRGFDDLAAAAAVIVAFYVPACAYAVLSLAGFEFRYDDGLADFYEWIDGGWIWMELAAIAGAVALYRLLRAPLLGLPLSLFALFLAMDGTARAVGLDEHSEPEAIGAGVLVFALLAGVAAVALDYRGLRRHAFWPHVFAAIGTVSGLECLMVEHSFELALVIAGGAFLAAGIWLGRATYLVAGGLSLWVGITALAPSPIVVTLSGLGLVAVAVWLSLAQSPLRQWLRTRTLPAPQRD